MLHNLIIGADHRGFIAKEYIKAASNLTLFDIGTSSTERTDYPIFAKKVCAGVRSGEFQGGILLCGSGAGMVIAANRTSGIYAAVAWNIEVAQKIRQDDWCNVLVLPVDFLLFEQLLPIVYAWAAACPKEGIYKDRLALID